VIQEQELIERAKAGDHDAFCLLARAYQQRIYALALHYTRDTHDAEDLSQEVWLKAFRAIGGFRGEAGFYTWLRQIMVNTFLNHQRGAKTVSGSDKKAFRLGKLVSLDELGLAAPEPQSVPQEKLHQEMMVEKVMDGLSELTAQQRLIFLLKHREGMTYEEIAEVCAITTGTVKKALFRAVNKLREVMGIKLDTTESASYAARDRR
jgi:RNA polymerase sigma-70 factor (ECF subfamily)